MYNPKFDGKKLESPRDNIDPKAALGEAAGIGMLFFFTVAAIFCLTLIVGFLLSSLYSWKLGLIIPITILSIYILFLNKSLNNKEDEWWIIFLSVAAILFLILFAGFLLGFHYSWKLGLIMPITIFSFLLYKLYRFFTPTSL